MQCRIICTVYSFIFTVLNCAAKDAPHPQTSFRNSSEAAFSHEYGEISLWTCSDIQCMAAGSRAARDATSSRGSTGGRGEPITVLVPEHVPVTHGNHEGTGCESAHADVDATPSTISQGIRSSNLMVHTMSLLTTYVQVTSPASEEHVVPVSQANHEGIAAGESAHVHVDATPSTSQGMNKAQII